MIVAVTRTLRNQGYAALDAGAGQRQHRGGTRRAVRTAGETVAAPGAFAKQSAPQPPVEARLRPVPPAARHRRCRAAAGADARRAPMPKFLDADRRFRRHVRHDVQKAGHRGVSGEARPGRSRATTAATSSTGTPTGWRNASAASCARGRARPTRSTSRAPTTPTSERFSPGERYGRVYQINYLRCIGCGLCIEACPTRALTMTNEYEMADDNRADLIYEQGQAAGSAASRACCRRRTPWAEGATDEDYYRGNVTANGLRDTQKPRRHRRMIG